MNNKIHGTIVVWHDEYLLSIGLGDDGPCPQGLVAALTPAMSYVQKDRAPWDADRDPVTGERRKFVFTPVDLYHVDERGRLCCQPGYLDRVADEAARMGFEVVVHHVKFEAYPDARPAAFEPDWAGYARGFAARDGQDEAIAALLARSYGRIEAAAGFGKTFAAAAMGLILPNAEIVLCVPTARVATTAERHFMQVLPASDVGKIGGGSKRRARVTICVVNSLLTWKYELRPDVLIVDECHLAVADKFAEAITTTGRRARIYGMSASFTPRGSNKHLRQEGLYGPIVFTRTAEESTEKGQIVPIRVVWHDVRIFPNPADHTRDDVARKRAGIWYNGPRNDVIARTAADYPDSERVLVLVETAAHALELARRLPGFQVCLRTVNDKLKENVLEAGVVDPSRVHRTPREQDRATARFESGEAPKLIGTDTLGIGFSPDACKVMVRADGRPAGDKVIQAAGRVSRLHAGKTHGTVHDFVDQFDVGFHRWAQNRRRGYAALGYEQVRADGTPVVSRSTA